MENKLIKYPTITSAIKARDILNKHSILSILERTPMNLKVTSCGYSLYVQGENIEKSLSILQKHNIKHLGTATRDRR